MILRSVMKHVRDQNWFAVGLDFLIVVVGVFIGLQVQEWSGRQEDRRRELQIVADLLADLDIDRAQYANALEADMRRIGAANASLVGAGLPAIDFSWAPTANDIVSYSLDLREVPAVPAARHDRMWTEVVTGYFPTPSTSTYDAMVGSGDIKIIADRDIVRQIQIYNNLANSVVVQNEKLLRLREDLLSIGASFGLAPHVSMPVEAFFRLVADEPHLAAVIRIQATFTIFHHGEIRAADSRAAALQDRLTGYLERQR